MWRSLVFTFKFEKCQKKVYVGKIIRSHPVPIRSLVEVAADGRRGLRWCRARSFWRAPKTVTSLSFRAASG